jgi:putative flippase GtrA
VSLAAQPGHGSRVWNLMPSSIRSRIRPQHVKFAAIGIYNTLFGYAVFAGLHLGFPHVNYIFVLIVSREVSVVSAFIAYRWLVFKVKGGLVGDFVRFWMVYSGALVMNLIALPFFVQIVGMSVLPAQALVVVLTVISTWIGHNHFSFKRDHVELEPESASETM